MTSISYNYNTKYTTKYKHALALYDVAINSTMHTCMPELARSNEINHNIHLANTLF